MDFMTALDIGASGMSADRTQLNVTAMNLANAKTTRMPGGNGPYIRKTVIKATSDLDNRFGVHMRTALDREVKGVRVMGVRTGQQAHPPRVRTRPSRRRCRGFCGIPRHQRRGGNGQHDDGPAQLRSQRHHCGHGEGDVHEGAWK